MKKLFLILILLCLTGCQVKYELNFNDDTLSEKISIEIEKDKNKIDEIKRTEPYAILKIGNRRKYEVKYQNKLDKFIANYTYDYNINSFRDAKYIRSCFDAVSLTEQNNEYTLATSKGFKCLNYEYQNIDNVNIKIKSNRVIINNNADIVKNDEYIWNIDESNDKDKTIFIKFGKIKEKTFFEKIIDYLEENKFLFIFLLIFVLPLIISIIIILKIGKKNNEI